jgi:hypothetical protein
MSILFDFKFDMIFADPPYFLSGGGVSMQRGKVVCVDKGDWDKPKSQEEMMEWNRNWLSLCREKLKANGSKAEPKPKCKSWVMRLRGHNSILPLKKSCLVLPLSPLFITFARA